MLPARSSRSRRLGDLTDWSPRSACVQAAPTCVENDAGWGDVPERGQGALPLSERVCG